VVDPLPYPGAPRWVKIFGAIAIVLTVAAVAIAAGIGEHHDGRHMPNDEGRLKDRPQ
jgi:hypothetical protein